MNVNSDYSVNAARVNEGRTVHHVRHVRHFPTLVFIKYI